MIFRPKTLLLAIAGLLLAALLVGCGDSGNSTNPRKKPQDESKINFKDLTKEQSSQTPQALETIREGRNLLNKEKLVAPVKEDGDSKAPARSRRHRRLEHRQQALDKNLDKSE